MSNNSISTTDHAAAAATELAAVPVVDISALCEVATPTQQALEQVAKEIHHAATELGFFYVRGHAIDPLVIARAMHATQAFFSQSVEVKETVLVNKQQRGWMPAGMAKLEGSATHDLKEVFFYGTEIAADDADLAAGVPLVAMNQWPDETMREFRQCILDYQTALCEIGQRVLSAIAVGFGESPDAFETHYQKPLARGQLVYYPPSQASDERDQRFGVAPHTDFGVLTLLLQDDAGGLQVKTRSGQWIEAPPIADTLVCNTGDLLQRWTNDRFLSTVHRVINRSGRKRFSMPLFYDPAANAVIDPQLLGVSQADAKHQPITTGDHIQMRNQRNFTHYKD